MRGPFNVDDSEFDSSSSKNDDASVSSKLSCPELESSSTNSHDGEHDKSSDGNMCEVEQMKLFAAVETAHVNRWKVLVVVSILIVGAAISTFTYVSLSNDQSNDAFSAVSQDKEPYNDT
jgi:hypothetical protein